MNQTKPQGELSVPLSGPNHLRCEERHARIHSTAGFLLSGLEAAPTSARSGRLENALLLCCRQPLGGNNLEISLPKITFESVPYSDSDAFVTALDQAWCDNTHSTADDWILLPSVKPRTGEELASYNCVIC